MWFALGVSQANLKSDFGHSWVFRHSDWSRVSLRLQICTSSPASPAFTRAPPPIARHVLNWRPSRALSHRSAGRSSLLSQDTKCPPLPDTSYYEDLANQSLTLLLPNVSAPGLSQMQIEVLSVNWRYCWCLTPEGTLLHDFKLYLGFVDSLAPGLDGMFDAELFVQQYFSSIYWSLTMLMKTPYVGPDTAVEKVGRAGRE